MRKYFVLMTALAVALALSGAAHATNGMNMISYGGQEGGMAGASLGVSNNAMAMNNNPAGLTQIPNNELDLGFSLLMPKLTHQDMVGNDKGGEDNRFPLPSFGYAHNLDRFVIGIGVFAQGGMGADFKGLNTAFGTQDDTYTNVRYLKVTPALAWRINNKWSVGAALNIGYSDMTMEFFPNTMVPGMFAGMELRDVYSYGYGGKFGVMYQPNSMVSIGAVYTTESVLDYDHGSITFAGLGKYDAKVDGFTWPQSLGVGIAIRPTPRLLLAADVTWYNWSKAMDKVSIKSNAPAPFDQVDFNMKWNDQTVFAIGAAYQLTDRLTVRAGYNYGNNPVPEEHLSPLFPAITEQHVAGGIGYKFSERWALDAAVEHAFEKSLTYNNPEAPFGPGAVEKHSQTTIHLMLSHRW